MTAISWEALHGAPAWYCQNCGYKANAFHIAAPVPECPRCHLVRWRSTPPDPTPKTGL